MSEEPLCVRDGCGHSLQVHTMRRAEKRAKTQGVVQSDYPAPEGHFNYHSGKTDGDACSASSCDCLMFISAR